MLKSHNSLVGLLALALLLGHLGFGADVHAPLPAKLVAAQTAYLQNDSGEQKFADSVFSELTKWGRWRITTDRTSADIVLVLDHKDRFVSNDFTLRILDAATGEVLWTTKRDVGIGTVGGVARGFISDIKKRIPPKP